MTVENSLKKILVSHKEELIKNNLDFFFGQIPKKNFSFEDLLSLSTQLDKKGLFSLNSLLLKTVLSQDNINYFTFSKQALLPQDDIYKVDLKKPPINRIESNNSYFFNGGLFEKYYPLLLEKLKDSLYKEGRYMESQGVNSVFNKEFNLSNDDKGLENKLYSDRKFVQENLYPSSSPESSYVLHFDNNIENLKRTIDSITSFGKKKELILLVDNSKEVDSLRKEEFIKKNLLSIEDENSFQDIDSKDNDSLNIRIVDLKGGFNKYTSYNLGALKSLSSNSKYVSFLKNGDVLDKGGFSNLISRLEGGKLFAVGGISYFDTSGKKVDDVNLRWRDYLYKNYKRDHLDKFENYSLFDFSNHVISSKNLEELLLSDKFVFDPRLDKHSAENDFFRRFVNKYSDKGIDYLEEISAHKEKNLNFNTKNGKKNILFITSTLENTHGVPVVVNNISNNLNKDKYNVFYFVNDFDSKKIRFFDSSKKNFIEATSRKELFEILKTYNPSFFDDVNIIHSHTWHLADDFKHFHTKNIRTGVHEEDETKFKDFLNYFSNAKFIFTDHSNPSEDLANINESYLKGKDYQKLSDLEKQKFLDNYKVHSIDDKDWMNRWAFTSMSGKKQMAYLANLVINVSNSQHEEGKKIIPGYTFSNQKTVYNGIDLIDITKDPSIDKEIGSLADSFKENYNLGKKDNVVLYAGRLSRRKGVFDLAESLKKLRNKVGNLKLLVVGDARADIRDKLKELSGMNNIIYTGKIADRKELAALYRIADITVQPTHGECFNQVIGESLSQGTPVIASSVSGPKEVYVDNNWAYGVERTSDHQRNINNLSAAINDALSNKHILRYDVKKRIIPEIREHLGLAKMVREHEKIYDNLSSNK